MEDHFVAREEMLAEGDRILVQLKGREIGVFNVDGEYYASVNWCAHQSGPVCEGNLSGTIEATFDRETLELEVVWERDGKILSCPWHGWEFDITTGDCLSKSGVKLPTYPVRVENGNVIVSV